MEQYRTPRIALYSPDTLGLGHVRRNLLIAQTLSKSHLGPNILLICGAHETEYFYMPVGTDCTILPSLYKEQDGQFRSRRLRMSLSEIISLRSQIMLASITAFDPDVFIVDYMPRGVADELDPTLKHLKEQGHCHCVLGMRDVWDEPVAVAEEWDRKKNWDTVRRYYDQILIYGDPSVYDVVREYNLEEDIADKIRYTGYLDQHARLELTPWKGFNNSLHGLELPDTRFVLCLLGGGQDGASLAEAFVQAKLPRGYYGILITGPRMDAKVQKDLQKLSEENNHLRVLEFVPEPALFLQHADCVISMGGYNAICAIMSFRKRALIVPRTVPSKEQLVRTQRLERLGIDLLHPDNLEAEAITKWLKDNTGRPPPSFKVDMNGLVSVLDTVESLITKEFCIGMTRHKKVYDIKKYTDIKR